MDNERWCGDGAALKRGCKSEARTPRASALGRRAEARVWISIFTATSINQRLRQPSSTAWPASRAAITASPTAAAAAAAGCLGEVGLGGRALAAPRPPQR